MPDLSDHTKILRCGDLSCPIYMCLTVHEFSFILFDFWYTRSANLHDCYKQNMHTPHNE